MTVHWTAALPPLCRRCGSVFRDHRCGGPPEPPLLTLTAEYDTEGLTYCGKCHHPVNSHHRTSSGRFTYCTVWSGMRAQCGCAAAVIPHG